MASILIVAGENSGEKYGAGLAHQFRKINPAFSFFGIGGEHMAAEGVEIIVPMEKLAVVGAVEILSHLPRLRMIFDQLKKEISKRRPVVSVLIDSPDFNLRLAKKIKKLSIPVLYYISPTVWAWRKGRLKTIKRTVDKMLLIFPFEEEIYQSHGIPAAYIGHPLKERVIVTLSKENFFQKYGLSSQKKLITLLPGSRKSELKYHMPVLARTIQQIKKEIPAHFILVLAEGLAGHSLDRYVPTDSDHLTILTKDNYEAMAYSDLVLSSCGTANLESALLETPFISFYRLSPFTYYAGVRFVRIRNYSIVNILAGKKIVPELIQKNFSPENICAEAKRILDSEAARSEMISNFRKIKELLGERKASQNAAQELDKLIKKNP